jgi:hypothetical protein
MGFVGRDQIIAAIAAGRHQTWNFNKNGGTPEAAGNWCSAWASAGSPGAGTASGAYANLTNATGSINFTDVSPAKRYLWRVDAMSVLSGTLMIYDRLGQAGSLSLASTGNKTVTSLALPRSMDAVDLNTVEAWVEVGTQTATTAPVLSMNSYTNEAGAGPRAGASLTFPATVTNSQWMGKLPLQAGDKAVQAISTINVSIAASAGDCAVVLLRPLAFIPVTANIATSVELTDLPRVYDGSSIGLALLATGTTALGLWGRLVTVYDS